MPLLVLVLVIAAVLGLTVRRATAAFTVTAALGLLGVIQMVWAVTDGQGNDPGWLIPLAVAAGCFDLAVCAAGRRFRGWGAAI